jgi:hypothetical protein
MEWPVAGPCRHGHVARWLLVHRSGKWREYTESEGQVPADWGRNQVLRFLPRANRPCPRRKNLADGRVLSRATIVPGRHI